MVVGNGCLLGKVRSEAVPCIFFVVLMVKDTCFGNALFLHWSQFVKILNFTKCEYLGLKSVAWVGVCFGMDGYPLCLVMMLPLTGRGLKKKWPELSWRIAWELIPLRSSSWF